MINTTRRLAWVALAIATLVHTVPVEAQPAPPPPQPEPYPQPQPQPYPQPQPQPYPQPYPAQPIPTAEPEPSGPEEITEFDPNAPVPYGYTSVSRKRKGFIIAGAATFGATYGAAVLFGVLGEELRRFGNHDTDVSAMLIPIAGPFIQASRTETPITRFYAIVDGVGQTAGAVMLIYGLTQPRRLLVRNDQLSIGPLIAPHASGLTISGRF